MTPEQLDRIMAKAQDACAHSGGRLTEKRKRILELLLMSNTPLSAYELANAYNLAGDATNASTKANTKATESAMPTMSVYRILSFLESEYLVHKLSSTNKFVACSHITCSHAHDVPQFLICHTCQSVKEIAIAKSIIDELGKQVADKGYKLINSQLELQCVCENCMESAA